MPTYEYSCDTCGNAFDWDQSFSEDSLTKCPGKRKGGPAIEACSSPGKGKVNKVFSAVGISFKGDGFYKNDHGAGAQSKKASEASSTTTSTDSSSDTKSETKADNKSDKKSDTKSEKKADKPAKKADKKKSSAKAKK